MSQIVFKNSIFQRIYWGILNCFYIGAFWISNLLISVSVWAFLLKFALSLLPIFTYDCSIVVSPDCLLSVSYLWSIDRLIYDWGIFRKFTILVSQFSFTVCEMAPVSQRTMFAIGNISTHNCFVFLILHYKSKINAKKVCQVLF